jgi:predicted Zn-dependent peptidase
MIINVNSITDLSSFYVVYNTTIKNETKGNRGISHLIEHLMCKEFDDLLIEFERNGIVWNAYTSDTKIVFFINGLDKYLLKYKDIFLEKLNIFNITEKNIELEKKIITEEYTDTFNKQSRSHFLNLYRKLFDIYNPIGNFNDIINLNINDINNFKNKYYKNPSKIINVSKNNKYYNNNIKFNNYDNNYNIKYIKDNKFIYENTNLFKSKISIIYLSPIISDDYPYISFITTMLGKGLYSPLYNELRKKNGLVYYINCFLDNLTDNSSVINISTETSDKNIDKLNDIIVNILKNKEKYLTKERFDIIKESYKIHFQKNEIHRFKNINKYISPKKWLVEPLLNDITLDKIYEIYEKYFIYDNFYVSFDKTEF